MKLTILFDRLRWEEKALQKEAQALGANAALVDAKPLVFEISRVRRAREFGDVVLQRCISFYRTLYLTRILENLGVSVVNPYLVTESCGNKLLTTLILAKAKIPTPRTMISLSSDTVAESAQKMGFPVVLKPFVGSWGRMVSIARDKEALLSIVELREELQNPIEHMYYLQEFVKRPPRDVRAVVAGDEIAACVYRYAPEDDWRTNVARGGLTKALKPNKELREIIFRAADAVGGGVLGVDAMESEEGYLVHEVNNTVEFAGAQAATSGSIARKIAAYVISRARK
ncbi:MAG: lysine biosynthesis protein LysX [Thaumarchaeota archaeon]|nr:lysine biosynthesis protein LysX [Nitrososphaerota archaeon]